MASVSLAQKNPVLAPAGDKIAPKRMMQVRFEMRNGQVIKTTPLSGWVEYKANGIKPAASTTVSVDHLEFIFDGTGALVPDENPAYTGNCGLGGSRYFFGTAYANPLSYDDMRCGAGTAGAAADRVAPAWSWNPAAATQCYLALFTTENFVTADAAGPNDPNDPVQVGYLPGIVYDFGSLAPGAGYYYADIDLTGSGLSHAMPADGNGGNVMVLANAFDSTTGQLTLANHPTQPMLWFTKVGNPSYLRGEFQWDDDNPVDAVWTDDAEYYSYAFAGTCSAIAPDEILGQTVAYLVPGSAPETVVPSAFTTIRGRLDAGNVGSLGANDDDYLRHCKFIVPNAIVPPIEVQVNGTTTKTSTTGVSAALTGRMANAGSFSHTVEQRNQVSLAYEDGTTAAVNTAESTITSNSTGNHNEKIGTGGALQARYYIRKTGPSAVAAFCYNADLFQWTVN
jgi:hypothetical protein